MYQSFGFAPVGMRQRYYAKVSKTPSSCEAPTTSTPPRYGERVSDALESELPGRTRGRVGWDRAMKAGRHESVEVGPDTVLLGIETSCDETPRPA